MYVFFMLKTFGSFGFLFMPPSFVWAPLTIENFLLCPQYCLGTFDHLGFLYVIVLAPSVGCDPSQGYFQKIITRLKRGLQMIYFRLMNGLSKKMTFPHLKHMHFGSVSLAFTRVCKVISHYSFK
jgi:hypothetical protein